jgi:hypothetical protein
LPVGGRQVPRHGNPENPIAASSVLVSLAGFARLGKIGEGILATPAESSAALPGNGEAAGNKILVSGHPVSQPASLPLPAPSPTPAPTGGFSTATSASSGFGSIFFLTLATLLACGAPQALRRLRLASEPWRPAPFVLIPDRPG